MIFGNINIWTCVILFIIYGIFDALYTLYLQAVSELKPTKASILSTILYLMSVYGTIEYINNFAYILPIALGGFIGGWLTIWWLKRNSEKDSENGE
jgi:membrane associated rhomboid family serine protease